MVSRLKARKFWWGKFKLLSAQGFRVLCWNCQRDLGREAFKGALMPSDYRCKILGLKWKALMREIKDEIVFDSSAIDELLNQINKDHYSVRQELKRREQEKA